MRAISIEGWQLERPSTPFRKTLSGHQEHCRSSLRPAGTEHAACQSCSPCPTNVWQPNVDALSGALYSSHGFSSSQSAFTDKAFRPAAPGSSISCCADGRLRCCVQKQHAGGAHAITGIHTHTNFIGQPCSLAGPEKQEYLLPHNPPRPVTDAELGTWGFAPLCHSRMIESSLRLEPQYHPRGTTFPPQTPSAAGPSFCLDGPFLTVISR